MTRGLEVRRARQMLFWFGGTTGQIRRIPLKPYLGYDVETCPYQPPPWKMRSTSRLGLLGRRCGHMSIYSIVSRSAERFRGLSRGCDR
jgi:hypothetical protein